MGKSMIGISKNGRYFVDSDGNPFFWLGDTQWNLFRSHTFEEAKHILNNRKEKGFLVIQVMFLGFFCDIDAPAVYGEAFHDMDPNRPNYRYFENVDSIIQFAEKNGLILVIGLDHPRIRLVNMNTAYSYGRWVGERYKSYRNIIWVPTYAIPSGENLEIMREIVRGLKDSGCDGNLFTSHPDPAIPTATSGIAHEESWLSFNSIQTFSSYHLISETVAADYRRFPPKPVVLAEGAYEDGPEYGIPITPYLIRKQAYWAYFAGGHHSYGHNDNWRVNPTWRETLDTQGAAQMGVLRRIFERFNWWELAPCSLDNKSSSDYRAPVALRSETGNLLLVYFSEYYETDIQTGAISTSDTVNITWINPKDGSEISAGVFPASGTKTFAPPRDWEDSLLVIKAL